jgi:hypothetical protein
LIENRLKETKSRSLELSTPAMEKEEENDCFVLGYGFVVGDF